MSADLEIIIGGSLVAVSCSLLGCFLILRKMAMVSDAISHAVLPGIVIAYLISGGRDSLVMFSGAIIMGMTTTFLIEFFNKTAKIQSDASIGITFTSLFAIGVILISKYAGKVDLDQDCVLYGDLAFMPLDRIITSSGIDLGPYGFWQLGVVFLLVLTFIIFFFKELKITTFDPVFAASIGMSTVVWHYLLMGAVSLATVASFESVGAILVVAFLIVPPSTAYLLTTDLRKMLIISSVVGILASVGGYYLAYFLDGTIAGAMAVVAGLEFVLALLFSPISGVITNRKRDPSRE